MTNVLNSSRRLLARAKTQRMDRRGSLVIAAASATLEAVEPGAGQRAALGIADPGLAFTVATAAEAQAPVPDRGLLQRMGAIVPIIIRADVLATTECLLARIDPAWAWSFIEELIGPEAVNVHGSIGLDIAAKADGRGSHINPQIWGPWAKAHANPMGAFARQLRARHPGSLVHTGTTRG